MNVDVPFRAQSKNPEQRRARLSLAAPPSASDGAEAEHRGEKIAHGVTQTLKNLSNMAPRFCTLSRELFFQRVDIEVHCKSVLEVIFTISTCKVHAGSHDQLTSKGKKVHYIFTTGPEPWLLMLTLHPVPSKHLQIASGLCRNFRDLYFILQRILMEMQLQT